MKHARQSLATRGVLAGADVAAAVSASVNSTLPVFLVAALAEQIRDALGFDGGVLGPFVFGVVVSHAGYPVDWTVAAGAALLGAVVMGASRYL